MNKSMKFHNKGTVSLIMNMLLLSCWKIYYFHFIDMKLSIFTLSSKNIRDNAFNMHCCAHQEILLSAPIFKRNCMHHNARSFHSAFYQCVPIHRKYDANVIESISLILLATLFLTWFFSNSYSINFLSPKLCSTIVIWHGVIKRK